MNGRISSIRNDVQDRSSIAWLKLCEAIDRLAESSNTIFSPRDLIGRELFTDISTLPESISKLKKIKTIVLYGSNLLRIPPEIGQMASLRNIDLYTSYQLHWLPYEITRCKSLKDSRISTRVLYGNYKNRLGFPRLDNNPVRYHGEKVLCSICNKEMECDETNQLWITLKIATDIVPLLANLCSKECEQKLPKPPENYVQSPHKGGASLIQPPPL